MDADKNKYRMSLGGLEIPILPENFKESVQIDHKKYDTFGVGERILPGKLKLRTWSISSYFPADGEKSPKEWKNLIDGWVNLDQKGQSTPVGFILAREEKGGKIIFGIHTDVLIESIEWEDRNGEPGDLYYTIKLVEYKEWNTKVV